MREREYRCRWGVWVIWSYKKIKVFIDEGVMYAYNVIRV